MATNTSTQKREPLRIGMTLDIDPSDVSAYKSHHDKSWPEITKALKSVGIQNLSLFNYGSRLFYYAEYIGKEDLDKALERYAKMPKVQEWEELMHKYQKKLEGSEGDVWWQPMQLIYHLD